MWEMLITFNKICLVLTYNAEWCAAYEGANCEYALFRA